MKKNTCAFFGLIALILIIWLLSAWQQSNLDKILSQNGSPELKIAGSEELSKLYQEFTSPDGKLKIQYPSSWFVVENEGLFSVLSSKDWKEKYNLKTLFLAQSFETGKFAQLMVQEGSFNILAGEIIEEMQNNNQKQGLEMQVIKKDVQDNKTIFEARYSIANSPSLYSKEEIISAGDKTYLIAFVTLETNWPEFTKEADAIISSAAVVQ